MSVRESVEIVIKAEDEASSEFKKVEHNVDASIKQIKEAGGKAKASIELSGVLARSLGGNALASFAGELAGVTEKVGQFSEMQKAGAAGQLAFQAGLVATAGVLSFQVGKAFGDVIFQTERYKVELENATKKSDELLAATIRLEMQRLGQEKEQIDLIRDPKERLQATKDLIDQVDKTVTDTNEKIDKINSGADKRLSRNMFANPGMAAMDLLGLSSASAASKSAREELEKMNAPRDTLLEQLKAETSARQQEINAIKASNAEKEKEESYINTLRQELAVLESKDKTLARIKQNATSDAGIEEATKLQKEIDALKSQSEKQQKSDKYLQDLREQVRVLELKRYGLEGILEIEKNTSGLFATAEAAWLQIKKGILEQEAESRKKLEQQKEQAAEKERQRIEMIRNLKDQELKQQEAQRIELEKGKEAAHAFRLEQQGMDKASAKDIARQQALLDQRRAMRDDAKTPKTLQAQETRLLTRGVENNDVQQQQLQATQQTNAQLQNAVSTLTAILPQVSEVVRFLPGVGAVLGAIKINTTQEPGDF